jgi:hypothetical protein
MKKILASLLVVGGLAALLMAQNTPAASPAAPDLPDVVVNGFKVFKTGGYTLATAAWARDSSLLLDPLPLPALKTYFSLIGNNAGQFVGADAIQVVKLSTTTEEVYAVAKFERQVIYMGFTCYKVGDKWIITVINADKDPAKILPTAMMGVIQASS